MSTIRAVLFDMDGLLVDSERIGIRASVRAGRALGYPVDEALAMQMLGLTREGSAAKYRAAIPGMDVEAFHAAFVREMEDEIEREGIPCMPGARELLVWLEARGIPCVLATSTARALADRRMERAGIARFFPLRVTGDDVVRSKPDPEIFLKAAALAETDPGACLVLEDSVNGIRAGRASGAVVGMVPDLTPYSGACAPYCDEVFQSLFEAREWLAQHIG